MTVTEVLEGVLLLLPTPESWLQGQYAGRRYGGTDPEWTIVAAVTITDGAANCFCLNGAIDRVIGSIGSELGKQVRDEICKTLGITKRLSLWNDDPQRTHEDILLAVDGTLGRLAEGAPS